MDAGDFEGIADEVHGDEDKISTMTWTIVKGIWMLGRGQIRSGGPDGSRTGCEIMSTLPQRMKEMSSRISSWTFGIMSQFSMWQILPCQTS